MAFTTKDPKDTYLAILNVGDANDTLPPTTPTATVLDAAGNSSILGLSQNTIEFINILTADVASGVVLDTGVDFEADAVTTTSVVYQSDSAVKVVFTTGDPEGSLTAGVGSVALRDDGVAGGTMYIKESGTGNTGWVPYDYVSSFLDLTDTPATFTADKWIKVNSGGTQLEWADAPIGSFIALSDTPASYTGQGGKTLRVNSAPDGVEFVDSTFLNLTDTPSSYTGDGVVTVNPGGTALIEIASAAAQGAVLHKGASGWTYIAAGSSGDVLTTQGAGADPQWTTITGSGLPSSTHGAVTYYNGSNWVALVPGTAGEVLTTQGAGSAPTWELGLPGSPVQGDVLYYSGSAWTRLAPGTSGQYLETQGPAANPQWSDVEAFPASPNQGEIVYYTGSVWANLAVGTDGYKLTTHSTGANPTWEANVFTGLTDTPANFTGSASKLVAVNSTPDALEFVANTVVGSTFSDTPSDYSTNGDIVFTNGSNAWEYQGISFFLNEKITNPFPDNGEVIIRTGGDTQWNVVEPMTTSEYVLSEKWQGQQVYGKLVDFGAGPNATSKSVATGIGTMDGWEIVDIRAMQNNPSYGWVGFSSETDEAASFVYSKIDQKIYCDTTTSGNDLSGNSYMVYIKYIKEPVDDTPGTGPHVLAHITGSWAGLAGGLHVLDPKSWTYTYTPNYDTPTDVNADWTWYGTTATANERIEIQGRGGSTRNSNLVFKNGATSANWSTKSWSSATPTGDYAKGIAFGDRIFTTYTANGVTLTIERASDMPKKP